MIRAKIRMAWTFHGLDDSYGRHAILVNRMNDAGMSRDAASRVLADPVLSIAEVEVDATGTIRILSIRPIEQCPSTHDGVRCSLKEEHGPAHIATVPIRGGVEVHRWKA